MTKKKKSPKNKAEKHFNTGKKYDTQKKRKAIKLFTENLGRDKPLTTYEILLAAGYSPESARQQTHVLSGIKDDPIYKNTISWMKNHRERLMQKMDNHLETDFLEYGEIVRAIAMLNKSIALGEGKPTEIFDVVDEDQKKALDRIADENE